jgi:DNA-directed RNA polymerase subunit F
MYEAQIMEMPFVADLPKREKSKLRKLWDGLSELSKVAEEKGMLIQQSVAAKLLDVSPQRVNDLVKLGRLEIYVFNGVPLVTENSVVDYAKSERKAGRPVGVPTTAKEAWQRARKKTPNK